MLFREAGQLRDRAGLRVGVRIRDHDELAGRLRDAAVNVRGERDRVCVLEHASARRPLPDAAGDVRDHDQLIDLRRQRG